MKRGSLALSQLIAPTKRVFIEGDLAPTLMMEDKLYNYLINVLKMRNNEHIYVLNRQGIGEYEILDVKKGRILLEKLSDRPLKGKPYNLIIYQAILKREYMDNVVEKSGELGVTKFIPVFTQRCTGSISKNTMRRYKDLIIKGALQAELEYIPEITEPLDLMDITIENKENFLFFEGCTEKSLPKIRSKDISLFIGPEGGLEVDEVEFLRDRGFQIISPTSSILKAETAAIVFIGIIKILMELT
jgi:16S rRNA (uracil1498-N3)-methyltransferase